MKTGRGGRKKKSEEQQLNQTVKTTLTKIDLEGLQQQYRQHTVGQKISFAEYIRQVLLAKTYLDNGGSDRSNLLAVQLELAELGEALIQIKSELQQRGTTFLVKEGVAVAVKDARDADQIEVRLSQNLDRIDVVIKQISQWLYDCSPERI